MSGVVVLLFVSPGQSLPKLKFGTSFDGIAVKGASLLALSLSLLGLLARVSATIKQHSSKKVGQATFKQHSSNKVGQPSSNIQATRLASNIQASRWEQASDRNQLAIVSCCDSKIVSG